MKLRILNQSKTEIGSKDLPIQFSEPVREDLIARAVLVIQNNNRQPYGAFPMAGKQCSAKLSRRRRDYKGSYGHGISRVPRKILSHRGSRFNWRGAFAPGTVGGRRAHPGKASKVWEQKINKKEKRKAIRSAMAATIDVNMVKARGHKVPELFPFIVSKEFENISKTKEILSILNKLGFENELKRNTRNIRAGKGKARGRKYAKTKSILFIVSKPCPLQKAAKNITGFDISEVKNVSAELLAPGTMPGRLTLYTETAIDELKNKNLFM